MKKISKIVSMILCIAMVASLCACAGTAGTAKKDGETTKLVWYLRSATPEGIDEVRAAVNEYLEAEMGITLEMQLIEPADYGSKCQLALASGEQVDLYWTGNWGGFTYETNVAKGAFMEIEDLLKEKAPKLWEYYKEGIWDATRVGGKIYAVPMEQIFHNQSGYAFMKDVAVKYGVEQRLRDMAWVDADTHGSMDELEEVFDIVRAGEPADYVITANGSFDTFNDYKSSVSGYSIVDDKVFHDKEDALEDALRARRWNEKGYFPADAATLENAEAYSKQGKEFTRYSRYLPGVEGKWRISHTYDAICIPTSEAVIDRRGIQSTLTAVSANCKNPELALQFIYRTLTDAKLLNLISYGIEGRDYTLIPDTDPQRMERDSAAYYISEFMVGSQFLAYLVPSYEDDVWVQTKYENDTARIDDLIGFSFDPAPVESEISSVSAAGQEYAKILTYGLEDPNIVWHECEKKKDLAGRQVIIDEINRQIAAWRAEQ